MVLVKLGLGGIGVAVLVGQKMVTDTEFEVAVTTPLPLL